MKKFLLSAILLFGLVYSANSQDKIITLNNDTIYCKITKISDYTIDFEVMSQGVKRSGRVDHNRIFKYIISEKSVPVEQIESEVNKEALEKLLMDTPVNPENRERSKKPAEEKIKVKKEPFERFRFAMNGGFGYLLGSSKTAEEKMIALGLTDDQAKSYYKEMKSGICAGADLLFLINPDWGGGVKYKFYSTSADMEGFIDPGDGYNLYYGTFHERIYVNFIGGEFLFRQFIGSRKTLKLNSACSIGLTKYRNEASFFSSAFLLTGNNIGADLSLGLEYFISNHFSLGTELSLFYSSIRKMKLSDGITTTPVHLEKDNYENLSRLDLSIGIRVYLWNK